jgi:hypothetical protein
MLDVYSRSQLPRGHGQHSQHEDFSFKWFDLLWRLPNVAASTNTLNAAAPSRFLTENILLAMYRLFNVGDY